MNKYQMVTELSSKDYVAFARRWVDEAAENMDTKQLREFFIDSYHEILEEILQDRGQQGVFYEMEGWDSDTFESVAKDYNLKLDDEWGGLLMDIKDQLTPEEYKRVIHVITHFQLGSRVNDFKTIKAKLKRQLASLENNGWYSK